MGRPGGPLESELGPHLFHLAEFREGGEAGEKPRRRVEKGRKALQTEHTRKPGEGIRCAYFREENREVKHRGVRFREQREGCRGPQGRSWNSGSGTGGPVQAAGCSRVTRFPGRAPPPARPGRGSFLFLPAAVGVGRASGHLPPPPAAGLVRLPGRLRLGRTPPARSRRVEPWSRGPSRAVSLDTGSPARPRGQNLWTPRTPDRLRAAPSRARPWTRPRGPGLAEAAGAGGALLGAEGPAAGGGIPGRGVSRREGSGGAAGESREESQGGVGRNLAPAPTRAVVTCSPREPGRARGEARSQLGLPLCARGTAGKAQRSRVFLAGGPALSHSLVRTVAICFQAEEKTSKTQTEGSVNPGPGMQGLLERQPVRSRPWDSAWPARPFPCTVDSVKPDLSSAYSVEVEAD
ncbi:collagen alpha-2(I) chain-like [Macaca thibetana thibetana]|uniref:collagen alpha-2(I) chain-like n=1 Tax=Macaca thibetana thibetana TaxID=257877 RepID=UPI0021BC8B5D|nr:collagen alpha-2(I) chain-like [Macaca thibetana thibetana]